MMSIYSVMNWKGFLYPISLAVKNIDCCRGAEVVSKYLCFLSPHTKCSFCSFSQFRDPAVKKIDKVLAFMGLVFLWEETDMNK